MIGYILSGLIGAAIVWFICGGWYLLGEWFNEVTLRRWEKKNNITD